MNDTMRMILFLVGYVVLMRWVLPRLGVRTCMSGNCAVPQRPKRAEEHKPDDSSTSVIPHAGER